MLNNYIPQTFSDKIIRMHDVRPAYGKLKTQGIAVCGERALVLPGLVILPGQVPESYLKYLQRINIGPSKVIQIPIDQANLVVNALRDNHTDRIREFVGEGHKLQFFYPTKADLDYVENVLGHSYDLSVWGTTPDLVIKTNDKVWQRRNSAENSVNVRFPEHYIVPLKNHSQIEQKVLAILKNHESAVLKHGKLAAGEGMYFINGPEPRRQCSEAIAKLTNHAIKSEEIIVEAGYTSHTPLSAQVEIGPDGPHYLIATIMNFQGTVLTGNTISSKPLDLPKNIEHELKIQSLNFAQSLYDAGYLGYVGFDFMFTKDGLFALEANGRTTAVTYLLAVALQAQNAGLSTWKAVSETICPEKTFDWDTLHETLKKQEILFNGQRGVLPVCPGMLPNKAMLYYIEAPDKIAALIKKAHKAIAK